MADGAAVRSMSMPALWGGAGLLATGLSVAAVLSLRLGSGTAPDALPDLQHILLFYSLLPRMVIALVCGAALGLAGLLMQRTLRNPLAEPSTLGVSAGAQFALTFAAVHAPALMESFREGVALCGGLVAAALVLLLNWRRGLEPVAVVLTGMIVSLVAAAGSAAVVLANGEYMLGLFVWGGGSLVQGDWGPTLALSWRLTAGLIAAVLLLRPLSLLGLGETGAKSLGVALGVTRLAVLGLAAWLASAVTAQVGIIGFVGLAAPALAALSGARTPAQKLVAAPLIGALLLWLADGFVLLASNLAGAERVPTGAATALLGGPLLLWLLPHLRMVEWANLSPAARNSRRIGRPAFALLGLCVAVFGAAVVSLCLGRGPTGWSFATGDLFSDLLPWRAPHVAVAAGAGAMLGAAGSVLQRVTANPLASPEILGVGAGAGVGLAAVLSWAPGASIFLRLLASAAASALVLFVLLGIAAKSRFGPERLLLAGAAAGAFCSAVLTAIIAGGSRLAFDLLGWLSGSINGATAGQGLFAIGAAVFLAAPLLLLRRWLDVLPLGAGPAQALGIPVRYAHTLLVLWAGLLSACASLFVGPLSFVGLLAPHMARVAGFGRAGTGLLAAALIGAFLLILSDWLSRMAAFPYQLPLGLFATLIGGPYLVWMLAGGVRRGGN